MPQDKIEQIITEEGKHKLLDHKFEINIPIEYNAMRTVMVLHIDKVISDYSNQEIIQNIETTNEWAKVEFAYKLTNNGRMLKICFTTTEMAARAIRDGLVVVYQRIPPRYIEKEMFVKLTPCYNCYSFDHKTQSCEINKQSICAFCAKTGHSQSNCTETTLKCINCEGKHKTLASVCPVRKRLIKERGKDVRERCRSRSRARQVTYADSVTPKQQQQQQQQFFLPSTNVDGQNMRDLVAKILTSITFAHYVEALKPGSFQNSMDAMFKENNLPKVNFPSSLITNEFRNLLDKTQNNTNETQNIDPPVEVNNANNKVNNDMGLEYHNKRAREGNSPVASRKKREMEREIERESEDEITHHHMETNIAKPQSERPEIAPKPQPLPQQDPRLLASAARARERESENEKRKSGRSRKREEARDRSRSSSYTRSPEITYANIFTLETAMKSISPLAIQIHMIKSKELSLIELRNFIGIAHHSHMKKIFSALISNNIDWGKVKLTNLSDDRVKAMKNELCNQ